MQNTVDDCWLTLADVQGLRATLVMFICNHCPFVTHIQQSLAALSVYFPQGLGIAAISANDASRYPADAPDKMQIFAKSNGFAFPYLYDREQQVAKAYGATCTPDFFLFDQQLRCAYRGRFDASTPGNGVPASGDELRAAIVALLDNRAVSTKQQPSIGCSIKWAS